MKKFAFIFGFLFCVTFAADAQLKYRLNGDVRLNVPDTYAPSFNAKLYGNPVSIMRAQIHYFVGKSTDQEFFIRPSAPGSCVMGPIRAGSIYMWGFTSAGTQDYHNLYIKNVYNSSDARAKTNIRPMSSATSTIMRLNPVTYQFVNRSYDQSAKSVAGADGTETGFLAQEVARVLPNAVAIDEEDNYLVNYISIIPVLVKAVQEQQAQIEALKAEISTLKNR